MKTQHIPLSKLVANTGQVPGLPKNPRSIRDEKFAKLVQSIKDDPEMLDLRELLVLPVGKQYVVIGGNMRLLALKELGYKDAPCKVLDKDTDPNKLRAYATKDNVGFGDWDWDALANEWDAGQLSDWGLDLPADFAAETTEGLTDPDDVPEVPETPVTVLGDVWLLGKHRVMCGDSTSKEQVAKLMAGQKAKLIHADPPYGMGKESDGVENDNIYGAELDRFQMNWWKAFRLHAEDNGSAYVWGNSPELWRLWYVGGLEKSEQLEIRNEIVWDKKAIAGMASPDLTQYPEASERCLFFQFGNQFRGNINTADFPETWEPLKNYLANEANAAGVGQAEIKNYCGVQMYGHWFTRAQFTLIPQKHYETLANAFPGHFARPWKTLKAEWDKVKGGPTSEIQGARSYFDNAHDVMRDVWEFPRVNGEERLGHATPKPVAMMERIMKSSLPDGGICAEPFGGSGPTLIGCETTGRVCFTMELQPKYCDVIVKRWQDFTGQKAIHEATGKTFDELASVPDETETEQ